MAMKELASKQIYTNRTINQNLQKKKLPKHNNQTSKKYLRIQ